MNDNNQNPQRGKVPAGCTVIAFITAVGFIMSVTTGSRSFPMFLIPLVIAVGIGLGMRNSVRKANQRANQPNPWQPQNPSQPYAGQPQVPQQYSRQGQPPVRPARPTASMNPNLPQSYSDRTQDPHSTPIPKWLKKSGADDMFSQHDRCSHWENPRPNYQSVKDPWDLPPEKDPWT